MWQSALPVLTGIRVLDLSLQLPGPYATRLLADMGAEVHRIEPPGGDPACAFPSLYTEVNAGKKVEEVDLKSDIGRRRVLDLARECDVLVEGFRPGVLARLGLSYEVVAQTNPGVIYCSISGYGQDGERAGKPGHDLTYHADAGTLAQNGDNYGIDGAIVGEFRGRNQDGLTGLAYGDINGPSGQDLFQGSMAAIRDTD